MASTRTAQADEVGGFCATGIECAKVQLSLTARKGATHLIRYADKQVARCDCANGGLTIKQR